MLRVLTGCGDKETTTYVLSASVISVEAGQRQEFKVLPVAASERQTSTITCTNLHPEVLRNTGVM